MKIKRLIEIDLTIVLIVAALVSFGILFIYSSGVTTSGILVSIEFQKQMIWGILGLVIALAIGISDYRKMYQFSGYIYIGMLLLLVYTRLFGKVVNGAQSWVGVGSFGIQPSEFAKLSTIIFLAYYLASSVRNQNSLKRFLISCAIVFVPVILILSQPDLGTSLAFFPILFMMTFIAGLPVSYVAYLFLFVAITGFLTILPLWHQYILRGAFPSLAVFSGSQAVLIFAFAFLGIALIAVFGYRRYQRKYFYWISYLSSVVSLSMLASLAARVVLKDYQIMRLIVFLDPNVDPRGSGWNIIQSITAIGSGGFWGKGFLQGTQSHYRFLPQQSTDFIFSIFSEEWGFIGGMIIFSLYAVLSLRIVHIMKTTSDPYGAYIATGLSAIMVFHFLVNVGMAMGVMPITGIPLIFMSYGGSSLLTAMIGIGIILSVQMRRFEH